MTTKLAYLYVNQNGRIVCAKHGGGYLRSHVEHRPNDAVFTTPLDAWTRVTPDEADEFDAHCEDCR
ncbi:MAG: hypothetical protein ABR616_10895 [Dermatophilaceae bacterium]|nr:hypothetical protein [Intrasporangiaceae bacterium]